MFLGLTADVGGKKSRDSATIDQTECEDYSMTLDDDHHSFSISLAQLRPNFPLGRA